MVHPMASLPSLPSHVGDDELPLVASMPSIHPSRLRRRWRPLHRAESDASASGSASSSSSGPKKRSFFEMLQSAMPEDGKLKISQELEVLKTISSDTSEDLAILRRIARSGSS